MLVRVDAEAAKEAENLRRNLLLAPASVAMLPLDDVMFLGKIVFTISHEWTSTLSTISSPSHVVSLAALRTEIMEDYNIQRSIRHRVGKDNLLRLLLLCRQYGDAATEAALEAASRVATEESTLAETAVEVEKKKSMEEEQFVSEAKKAEKERHDLLLEAEKALMEHRLKTNAAKAAEAARDDAARRATPHGSSIPARPSAFGPNGFMAGEAHEKSWSLQQSLGVH